MEQASADNGQKQPVLLVAVVSDTHVPDRIRALPAALLDALNAVQPKLILHSGDICVPSVLAELEKIAPLTAVRGNRDWAFIDTLPIVHMLELNGLKVAMTHGSGTVWEYVRDQFIYVLHGFRGERYIKLAAKYAGDAQVVVFGHSHRPMNEMHGGRLFFNPGSACFAPPEGGTPSFGLLRFYEDGSVQGEIVRLPIDVPKKLLSQKFENT